MLFGSYDKLLHAVDVATGLARWTYALDAGIHASVAVARDGSLAVGSLTGTFAYLSWPKINDEL
jgi:outer membrane protein assembly factor BamB